MCEYCQEAFTNLYEEDCDPANLSVNVVHGYFGEVVSMFNYIDSHGTLSVSVEGYKINKTLLSRRIRFCPMCGSEIPKITPTDRHNGKDDGRR